MKNEMPYKNGLIFCIKTQPLKDDKLETPQGFGLR